MIKKLSSQNYKTNISNFWRRICTSVDKYESRTLQTKNNIFSPTFHDINQQQSKIMICISQKAHTNKRVLPNIKQDEIKWKFQPLLSEPEFIVPLKTKAYKQSQAKY